MMHIRKRTVVIIFIILIAIVSVCGCLGTKEPVAPVQDPPALLLDYHRTGGFAGIDDHLIIFNNGAGLILTRSATREFQLNSSEIRRLEQMFRDAGFESLQDQYTSGPGSADLMAYSIAFGNKTVVTEDTAVPYSLQSVIRELNAIITARSFGDQVSGSLANIRT